MKNLIMTVVCAVLVSPGFTQKVQDVLNQIETNNKKIKAASILVDASKIELITGINPDDPFLEADYMLGRPIAGGDQFDFTAVQAFDFPSVYGRRKQVAASKGKVLDQNFREVRQEILFEANELCIIGIHLNRKQQVYEERKQLSQSIADDYEKKFNAEEISILDLNKAKIQLLGIEVELRSLKSAIRINNAHLTELNGGVETAITNNAYEEVGDLPTYEVLLDSIERADPSLHALEEQAKVYEANFMVSKAMKLPKFEAGYHYQSVLGQTFNGAHFGVSIPLWQQKNTVKSSLAKIELGKIMLDEHRVEHHYKINERYSMYLNLKENLQEFNKVLNANDNEEILKQLLLAGEIDFITYALELEYFYKAQDDMQTTEKEYQITIAELLKYKL